MINEKIVFLTDGVVNLRPVLRADLVFLLATINDPIVRATIGSFLPQSEEEEEEWIKNLGKKKQTDITFVIEIEDKPIGMMGIGKIIWKDRTATTGAAIKAVEHRGKGYGTRAKMLLLHYAFNELNLRKICSGALAFNLASLRFNEKCGYKEEGRQKEQVFKAGEHHDLVFTAVFQKDYEPLWEEHKKKHNLDM